MKSVLVFGGSGFLGYYLVQELLQRKYKVTIADIASTNDFPEASYVKCDISKREEVEKAFELQHFDIVYNLAGFANLERAIENPLKTIELNVVSNIYIIEACLAHKISKFVYASSAYASSNKGSFYGISKLASEKIIEEYHRKYNLPFIILRYGSVYSERDYDNNYIYSLVKEAMLSGKIEHHGDGKEVREYIHAADAATLSVDVIESEAFSNMHMILTGAEKMQRIDLFNMIKELLNEKVEIHCNDSGYTNHYKFISYSFEPLVSKKLIANPHIDMGQGLLECVKAVYRNEK